MTFQFVLKKSFTYMKANKPELIKLGPSAVKKGCRVSRSLYKCVCGAVLELRDDHVKSGRRVSCGCYPKAINELITRECERIVGVKRAGAYRTWLSIVERCLDSNYDGYKDYGAKGITVCDEWQTFEGFIADMGRKPDQAVLKRRDTKKGYSFENCYWYIHGLS